MSGQKNILIADPDQKALLKIEDALGELDVRISIAADGAQTLERALSVRQDLFLFADHLPVIDTEKLLEILRNNPRTAGVPVVILNGKGASASFGDAALSKPVDRQQVIDTVLRYAFQVGSTTEGKDQLSGLLTEMPLADLLQIMRANRREGLLEIEGQVSGTIWLSKGEIIDARCNKAQGLKAFFRLMQAEEGRFVFRTSKVLRQAAMDMPLQALLLEASRQRDELERLRKKSPLRGRLTVLRELGALPEGLHPVHRELLLLVEFYGNAEDVLENAKVPDLEAYQGLGTLVDGGLIGLGGDVERDKGLHLEPSLVVSLKQAAGHSPRRARPVRVAVFVSAADVISSLYDVLQPARWFKHQDRVLGNRIRYALDGEFSLDLDFYPPGMRFSPLVQLPPGMLCGGLVIAGDTDDKELDCLNESAAMMQAMDLPVEFLYYGESAAAAEWMSKAFTLEADAVLHRFHHDHREPLLDALRSIVMRRAAGWTVGAR